MAAPSSLEQREDIHKSVDTPASTNGAERLGILLAASLKELRKKNIPAGQLRSQKMEAELPLDPGRGTPME